MFNYYYVVCGTQTAYTYRITETAVNLTGLSVFTRYECCVTVYITTLLVASQTVLMPPLLQVWFQLHYMCSKCMLASTLTQISLLPPWLSISLTSHISPFNWSGLGHNPSMASSPTTPLHACKLMELLWAWIPLLIDWRLWASFNLWPTTLAASLLLIKLVKEMTPVWMQGLNKVCWHSINELLYLSFYVQHAWITDA